MTLIGIEKVNYTSKKTGNPVTGHTIYFTYKKKDIEGLACDSEFVSDKLLVEAPNIMNQLEIGCEFRILYGKFGTVQDIELL